MRTHFLHAPLAALTLAIAACSPGSTDAAPVAASTAARLHPVSGLPVIPLTVESGGKVHRFEVELASTAAEQSRGLMFRTEMGANEGMVFPFKPHRMASFWMRNTVIGLDIIFVGPDGRIINIEADAIPYDELPLESDGLAAAVLELNAGRAAQLGIKPGDRVRW
jgi:uncharacterized membrane protein (UPF0127 family)